MKIRELYIMKLNRAQQISMLLEIARMNLREAPLTHQQFMDLLSRYHTTKKEEVRDGNVA